MVTLLDRCLDIELLVVDVDGVLTDGGIVYGTDGQEIKQFHVRDGSGLKRWQRAGKKAAVLTGRSSNVVERRAGELGLAPVVQGAGDKLAGLEVILKGTGHSAAQTCYIGDDMPDLPVLSAVRLAVTVADACPEAREVAHYVTIARGGHGAVRETIELILRAQGRWKDTETVVSPTR